MIGGFAGIFYFFFFSYKINYFILIFNWLQPFLCFDIPPSYPPGGALDLQGQRGEVPTAPFLGKT